MVKDEITEPKAKRRRVVDIVRVPITEATLEQHDRTAPPLPDYDEMTSLVRIFQLKPKTRKEREYPQWGADMKHQCRRQWWRWRQNRQQSSYF